MSKSKKKSNKKTLKLKGKITSNLLKLGKFTVITLPFIGSIFLYISFSALFYLLLGLCFSLILALAISPNFFRQVRRNKPNLRQIKTWPQKVKKKLSGKTTKKSAKKKKLTKKELIIWLVSSSFISLVLSLSFFNYLIINKLPFSSSQIASAEKSSLKTLLITYYQVWKKFFNRGHSLLNLFVGAVITLLMISFITSVILLIKDKNSKKPWLNPTLKKLAILPSIILIISVISFNLSIFTSLSIKTLKFKKFAQKLSSDPKAVGILTEPEAIKEQIANKTEELAIKQFSNDQAYELAEKLSFQQDKSDFYNIFLTSQIPTKLRPEVKLPEAKMLYANQQLLITEIDQDQVQIISPDLGEFLVSNHFADLNIKHPPESLEVISRQDYLDYRDDQINQEIEEMEEQIKEKRGQISANQSAAQNTVFQWARGEISYDQARSRYFSYQNKIAALRAEISELQEIINLIEGQKDSAPNELGLYVPADNEIKVVLDKTNPEALTQYLAILTHEYLHYASYVNDERYLPLFFEEGLTEYFTREILREELGIDAYVGYPIVVRTVESLVRDIDHDQLLKAYFSKDTDLLISLLNKQHGDNFYQDSFIHFATIQYSTFDEALSLANDLIEETGGQSITKEEIFAEYSQEKQKEIEEEATAEKDK